MCTLIYMNVNDYFIIMRTGFIPFWHPKVCSRNNKFWTLETSVTKTMLLSVQRRLNIAYSSSRVQDLSQHSGDAHTNLYFRGRSEIRYVLHWCTYMTGNKCVVFNDCKCFYDGTSDKAHGIYILGYLLLSRNWYWVLF